MRKKKKAKKVSAPVSTAVPAITKRPTIDELEKLLDAEEDTTIEILPNGEIRALSPERMAQQPKPITMRERLGGEYAVA